MRFAVLCSVCLALTLVSGAGPETADVAKSKVAVEKRTDHKAASKPLPLIHYAQSGVIAFSPDGKTIASGGWFVCLHDLTTGRLLWRSITDFNQEETCTSLVFSSDGKYLAATYKGGFIDSPDYVVLWEVTRERKLHKRRILLTRVHAAPDLAFSPDSKTLLSGSRDGTIYLWDAPTGKELRHFKGGVAATFAADGRSLICVSHDGTIRHRQIPTGELVSDRKQAARTDFIHAGQVAFSPDKTRLAVSDGYTLSLKDVETGEVITRIDFQGNSIGVDFTPDSQTLMVITNDFIRFLDASTGLERFDFKIPREWTASLAFSCDGKFIACGDKITSPPGLLTSLLKFLDLEWEEDILRIQDMATVLKSAEKPTHEAKTEPGKGLLQAEIIANQQTFECSLGGRTPEEFSDLIGSEEEEYPPGPRVNLTFKLRNVSNQKVTLFNPDKKLSTLYLFGPGAMNLRPLSSQQFAPFGLGGPPPEYLTLGPGDSYSFSVADLAGSWDSRRYWLTPGEYTVRALYHCCISPAPEGAFKIGDGLGSIWIWTSPLKINVVASK